MKPPILSHSFDGNGNHQVVVTQGTTRIASRWYGYHQTAQLVYEGKLICAVTQYYSGTFPEFFVIDPAVSANPFAILDCDEEHMALDTVIANVLHDQRVNSPSPKES